MKDNFKICLMSGTSCIGKTTMNNRLRESFNDPLMQFVDSDILKALMLLEKNGIQYEDMWKLTNAEYHDECASTLWRMMADNGIMSQFKTSGNQTEHEYLEESQQIAKRLAEMAQKSIKQGKSGLIASGVSIVPGQFDALAFPDADVTQVLLKIDDEKEHWRRMVGRFDKRCQERGGVSEEERATRINSIQGSFSKIRDKQMLLVELATKAHIPMLEIDETASNKILKMIGPIQEQKDKGRSEN